MDHAQTSQGQSQLAPLESYGQSTERNFQYFTKTEKEITKSLLRFNLESPKLPFQHACHPLVYTQCHLQRTTCHLRNFQVKHEHTLHFLHRYFVWWTVGTGMTSAVWHISHGHKQYAIDLHSAVISFCKFTGLRQGDVCEQYCRCSL